MTEKPRKRYMWVAILLAILTPFMSMLYLGKGWRAIAYMLAELFVYTIVFAVSYINLGINSGYFYLLTWIVTVVGVIDSYRIAKLYREQFSGPWYSRWYGIPLIYLIIIVPIALFRTFLYEPFRIPAASMAPVLIPGDYILVKKFGYGNYGAYGITFYTNNTPHLGDRIKRGDIIVFKYPKNPNIDYVKRVIGLPGDLVEYHDKQLSINNHLVRKELIGVHEESDRQYTYSWENLDGKRFQIKDQLDRRAINFSLKIPDNLYFVMGDNRDNSNDSRYWGPLPASNIVGKVQIIVWSFDKESGKTRQERLFTKPQ